MAQVWLTYGELAAFLNCGEMTCRARVRNEGWACRRSRDRAVRVKLPPGLSHEYMLHYAERFCSEHAEGLLAELRSVLAEMKARSHSDGGLSPRPMLLPYRK